MAIKKYIAEKDNTITNAFESNLSTRGTGSNMGASDILEVFSIYGQAQQPSSSVTGAGSGKTTELSRILIQFPIADIIADRNRGDLPVSGNVDFYLKMYNAKHGETTPRNMTLNVVPVSASWEEGFGLDMEGYRDLTRDEEGSNWVRSAANTSWERQGGDYHTGSSDHGDEDTNRAKTVNFTKGIEDLELDVTDTVEEWIAGTISNYGFGVHLTGTQEAHFSSSTAADTGSVLNNLTGSKRSYYTKRFFARGSEFFFKKPTIEARWDSSTKDHRGSFHYSSSLVSADENINTIYFYNYFRGRLRNVPGIDSKGSEIYVRIYSGSDDGTDIPEGPAIDLVQTDLVNGTVITGGYEDVGVYTASFALTSSANPLAKLHDVWFSGSSGAGDEGAAGSEGLTVHTGSIYPVTHTAKEYNPKPTYVNNITNLKPIYDKNETPRFRVYAREKNWCPSIYTKATQASESENVEDAYYRVYRVVDGLEVIPYGTGSTSPLATGNAKSYTRLSYDSSGSYFDLDMSLLEPGYAYALKLSYYLNNSYVEQPETFKFRVEEKE